MKEKEANVPWVAQRTNKAPGQGLHRSQRHTLEEVLKARGRRVSSTLQRISQREGGGEREIWGPKSLVEQGCFNDL